MSRSRSCSVSPAAVTHKVLSLKGDKAVCLESKASYDIIFFWIGTLGMGQCLIGSWTALFASAAASFVMEGFGASNFGTRDQIMGRIKDFVAAYSGQFIVRVAEKWLASG